MYINLLRYSKVPNRTQLNGSGIARKLKRQYCYLTYNKDKFVIEVYAYDANYHNGDHEDIIRQEVPITEELAFELLRKYNK
jgi:hypothetical protein